MCTLVVGCSDGRLVVGANRDELLARPARPPFLWPHPSGPRMIAPKDDQAGGTWLGINAAKLFVAVVNQAPRGEPKAAPRSRGDLVVDALRRTSRAEVASFLAGIRPGDFAPFHLLVADPGGAGVTWSDGARLEQVELPPGVHAVTPRIPHVRLDPAPGEPPAHVDPRVSRLAASWPIDSIRAGETPFEAMRAALSAHDAAHPLDGTCVHADAVGYGTRSSMLLSLGAKWSDARFAWTEGKPCLTEPVDRSDLLRSLGA